MQSLLTTVPLPLIPDTNQHNSSSRSIMKLFGVKHHRLPAALISNPERVEQIQRLKGGDFSADGLSSFASTWEQGEGLVPTG